MHNPPQSLAALAPPQRDSRVSSNPQHTRPSGVRTLKKIHGPTLNKAMSDIDGIRRVAVLGLGTMGHGIAQTFALAGYEVNCFDESASMRDSLAERVSASLAAFVAADVLAPEQIKLALARLKP